MKHVQSEQPGAWKVVSPPKNSRERLYHYICFNCPCGCAYGDFVCIVKEGDPRPSFTHWTWNGREDLPTLSPSLRRSTPCKFHGFLKEGVWSACSDGAPLAPNVFRGVKGQ